MFPALRLQAPELKGRRVMGTLKSGPLLDPLREKKYFQPLFVESGALCWPNACMKGSGLAIRQIKKVLKNTKKSKKRGQAQRFHPRAADECFEAG